MDIKEAKDFKNYAVKHHGMSSMHLEKYMSTVSNSGIQNLTRTVIEERQMPFREVDVFSRLMMDRIIFLGTDVNHLMRVPMYRFTSIHLVVKYILVWEFTIPCNM